jgi:hypothetical protein
MALAMLATAMGADTISWSAGAGQGTTLNAATVFSQGNMNDPAALIRTLLLEARDVRALRLREPRVVMQREPPPAEFGDLIGGVVVSGPDRAALATLFAKLKPNTTLQSANPFVADYAFVFELADPDPVAYLLVSTFTKNARLVGRVVPGALALPLNLDPIFPQLNDALVHIVEKGRWR